MIEVRMRAKSPRVVAGVVLAALAVLLSIPVLDYARSPQGDWLHPLGFQAWASVPPAAWGLAVAMGVLFALLTTRGMPAVRDTWRELSPLKLVSIWAAVGAAIVEEAFFRRVIMDAVSQVGGSVALQVLASAVGFGVAHALWGLIKLDLWVAVSSVTATTVMGLGLALVYLVANRNLAPCIVGHFIITATVEPGLMIAAVSGQWDRTVSSDAGVATEDVA